MFKGTSSKVVSAAAGDGASSAAPLLSRFASRCSVRVFFVFLFLGFGFGFWFSVFGFRILDFGYSILDFGFRV